ncbi:molecular chaperone TorD family protein [Vibrio sp.]|uniref:Dehydrogenase n=1 Tax=Vibrio viridaestus TaxID=2487322 RepID=A0A3N9TES2_9VIBR|nr:molecular chaperone TorD family protein [Vibrio viridaestus]MDC0611389.1 molecular chaperone TorD family protein [Vibrio sp.]RQW62737.1 hypothetical protein EES38_13505 [Vibrio viridaestus]
MQLSELQQGELVIVCRLYGALFYYSPSDFDKVQLNTYFQHDVETPIDDINTVLNAFKHADKYALIQEYDRLFTQQFPYCVPPWSSVYLDNGNPLFGSATTSYSEFIEHCGLKLRENATDPEDHIGLMLMVLAMLIDDDQDQHVSELLGEYLLPWFPFFISKMQQESRQDAYIQLTKGTQDLLSLLQKKYSARVLIKTNYLPVV